jgi:hypothetical protein
MTDKVQVPEDVTHHTLTVPQPLRMELMRLLSPLAVAAGMTENSGAPELVAALDAILLAVHAAGFQEGLSLAARHYNQDEPVVELDPEVSRG